MRVAPARSVSAALAALSLLLPLLLPVSAARAHPAQFGSIHAREATPGRVVVRFEYSGDEDAPRGAVIAWPDGCAVEGSVERTDRPFGETQRMVVRCDEEGLAREATVEALPAGVQIAVRLERSDGSTLDTVLDARAPSFVLGPRPAPSLAAFGRYLALGVEHIALGLDHLLFVAALVLVHRRARASTDPATRPAIEVPRLLGTLTAFTLGHSVTLALAVLDLVRVPAAPVEACIALSIVLVAAEVARAERGGGRDTLTFERPWLVAGLFGLVHGLGFAGALRETGLPVGAIGTALAAFNVGVEVGQIAFVALLLATLALLERTSLARRAPLAIAYLAGSMAVAWTFDRVLALAIA